MKIFFSRSGEKCTSHERYALYEKKKKTMNNSLVKYIEAIKDF